MKSEIQIEGMLGSYQETTTSSSSSPSPSKEQIVNVQVASGYPKTGESQTYYLFFSGLCLLLILLVLKRKKTSD
ncbi:MULTISPECIES: LPXTG cell wall anchor domain-containing protein [Enterococcus]|uniref:LPXTG cell wall anchor domain-containing protein n=1 Tax=Candidatus Enterococcus murrayae TaxID=2815321 RepID=A0ABS3HCF2_9ENTE|nr:LPXTG cell wall anchor domain-containing protein [Enterococcus sp. MJM16]MBO0451119.1 LPXTG cell wall anchor domain-containing protein [Enterococcus sp. MJM16]